MGRRAMTAVTMTVLVVLLVVAALVGWRAISSPSDGKDPSATGNGKKCVSGLRKGDLVRSREVTVSVYNAGSRAGLAGETQDALAQRKFIRGEVGNAPASMDGVRTVRILAPTRDDPAARLVARQFGRNVLIQATKNDLGPGVDVVVGNEFSGLVKAPDDLKATARGSGC